MSFKLKRLEASVQDGYRLDGAKRAEQIAIMRTHIDRYQNSPWLCTGVVELDCIKDPDGWKIEKRFGEALLARAQYENSEKLEKYHWDRIWQMVARLGNHWWD